MKKWSQWMMLGSFAFVAACVTINVYFPAAEVESAAEEMVKDIFGEPEDTEAKDEQSSIMDWQWNQVVDAINPISWVIGTAHAQANIDVSSPAISALHGRIKSRFDSALKSHLDNQTVGLTKDGLVAVVDASKLGLKDRQVVNKLVADENRDRNALYREIAVANGHPEWEDQIREAFVKQWTAQARSGWKYQNASGQWQTK